MKKVIISCLVLLSMVLLFGCNNKQPEKTEHKKGDVSELKQFNEEDKSESADFSVNGTTLSLPVEVSEFEEKTGFKRGDDFKCSKNMLTDFTFTNDNGDKAVVTVYDAGNNTYKISDFDISSATGEYGVDVTAPFGTETFSINKEYEADYFPEDDSQAEYYKMLSKSKVVENSKVTFVYTMPIKKSTPYSIKIITDETTKKVLELKLSHYAE